MKLKKMVRNPLVPLALIVASGVGWASLNDDAPAAIDDVAAQGSTAGADDVMFIEALEETQSLTATDWAGAADVVVTGTVTQETELPEPQSETTDENGAGLVGRSVTVKVTDTLWQSPDATVPEPTVITMNALGWMRADGALRRVATEGTPRLEVGHDYVLALVWQPAQCSDGDFIPARWTWIGTGGVLPADKGVVGRGESEGDTVTVADTKSEAEAASVEAANAGQRPTAVVADLNKVDDAVARTWPRRKNTCRS